MYIDKGTMNMFKYIGFFPIKLQSLPSQAYHARLLLRNFDHTLSSIYSINLQTRLKRFCRRLIRALVYYFTVQWLNNAGFGCY